MSEAYKIKIDNDDNTINVDFQIGDIILSQEFDGKNVNRIVAYVIDVDIESFSVIPVTEGDVTKAKSWSRIGNSLNTDRQAYINIDAEGDNSPQISMYSEVSKYSEFNSYDKLKVLIGNLDQITDPLFPSINGYGLLTDNCYLRGEFVLNSGDNVGVKIDDQGALIQANENSITVNAGGIDLLTQTTTTNGNNIATNTAAINVNAGEIDLRATTANLNLLDDRVQTNESSITVNSEQINLRVTSDDFIVLENTVSSNTSAITVNSKQINLRVESTEFDIIDLDNDKANQATILAEINLSAEGVLIKGDRITVGNFTVEDLYIYTGVKQINNDYTTSTGDLTIGNGAIRANQFRIDTNGSAHFKGALEAASGTFKGDLTAAGGTFKGDLTAAGGTFKGDLTAAGGTFTGALSAATGSFTGALTATSISTNSGKFSVSAAGEMIAVGGGSVGGWDIEDYTLLSDNGVITLDAINEHISINTTYDDGYGNILNDDSVLSSNGYNYVGDGSLVIPPSTVTVPPPDIIFPQSHYGTTITGIHAGVESYVRDAAGTSIITTGLYGKAQNFDATSRAYSLYGDGKAFISAIQQGTLRIDTASTDANNPTLVVVNEHGYVSILPNASNVYIKLFGFGNGSKLTIFNRYDGARRVNIVSSILGYSQLFLNGGECIDLIYDDNPKVGFNDAPTNPWVIVSRYSY